jgi:ATP-dependent RNA helicase RhlE
MTDSSERTHTHTPAQAQTEAKPSGSSPARVEHPPAPAPYAPSPARAGRRRRRRSSAGRQAQHAEQDRQNGQSQQAPTPQRGQQEQTAPRGKQEHPTQRHRQTHDDRPATGSVTSPSTTPASGPATGAQSDTQARPSAPRPSGHDVPAAFARLGLNDDILQAIAAMGYVDPTPIQAQAIPQVLEGRDVLGCAQTGTGKTAAFVLPILQRIDAGGGLQALVVTPTRELAAQIDEVACAASKRSGHRIAAVFGGTPYEPSAKKVRRGVDMLVATPGRLLDMVQRGDVKLGTARILVLDEADRMLDMGFWPDVRRIISKLPPKRQNLLFSATLSRSMLDVIGDTLSDPVRVQIGEAATPVDEVLQKVYPVVSTQKMDLLIEFLHHHKPERALIFTRTKHRADRLARVLTKAGINGTTMHSNRTQSQREQALEGFKSGKYTVLVATDIVARGIDVEGISHVVNYDIPLNAEDYVHRIGRTARAGADGTAVSFLTAEEVHELKAIERLIGGEIDRHDLPGFDYDKRVIPESKDVPRKPGKSMWRGGVKRGGRSFLRGHAH